MNYIVSFCVGMRRMDGSGTRTHADKPVESKGRKGNRRWIDPGGLVGEASPKMDDDKLSEQWRS